MCLPSIHANPRIKDHPSPIILHHTHILSPQSSTQLLCYSKMYTVVVTNISPEVTKAQLENFFSFCGKIDTTDITDAVDNTTGAKTQTATVRFAEEEAAKTALLLTDTQLGSTKVVIEKGEGLSGEGSAAATSAAGSDSDDVPQEAKPKAAVLAEIISHGYVLSDKALQHATELDQKHGISSRFSKFLTDIDTKYNLSDRATSTAQAADQKYNIREHLQNTHGLMHRYFEKALDNSAGSQVRKFYADASKTAADIHGEAKRLAAIREGQNTGSTVEGGATTEGTSAAVSQDEKAAPVAAGAADSLNATQ
ncbi:actin cytoskeleton protein [Myxozyma melibiosi]|uniref:Actin cytoskeleton protein n=1 Tax=Myxozyma melibiosi TaxID=54550 RepID=A0ABR1F284_9ASCO